MPHPPRPVFNRPRADRPRRRFRLVVAAALVGVALGAGAFAHPIESESPTSPPHGLLPHAAAHR